MDESEVTVQIGERMLAALRKRMTRWNPSVESMPDTALKAAIEESLVDYAVSGAFELATGTQRAETLFGIASRKALVAQL